MFRQELLRLTRLRASPGCLMVCGALLRDLITNIFCSLFDRVAISRVCAGDTLTVYFTQITNSPNVSNTAAIQQLFAFNPWLSTNMSGVVRTHVTLSYDFYTFLTCVSCFVPQWYTGGDSTYASAAQRLVITIAGSVNSNYSATAIGTASISLLSSGRLTNAAGTSQPASSTSNLITGTWGAFNQPAFVSTVSQAQHFYCSKCSC